MIQANELRIGNLILYLNELYKVSGIRFEQNAPSSKWRIFFTTVDGFLRNAKMENWIEPIPLTPDILMKCGFKNDGEYLFVQPEFENIHFRLIEFPQGHWIASKGFINYNHELSNLKYLHELQNLYFAVMKMELYEFIDPYKF